MARNGRTRREWGSIVKRGTRYYVRFRDAAGQHRWRAGGDRLAAAEQRLRELRAEVDVARRRRVAPNRTLAEWWDDTYRAVLAARLRPRGVKTASAHVRRFAEWARTARGNPGMRDVTRAHAQDFVAFLASSGLRASYVRRLVNTLRSAWRDAEARGLVEANVWSALTLATPEPTHVPWISPEQLRALYDALPQRWRPHLVLIGETGMRIGEALALVRDDVELVDGRARVHVRRGKTAAARRTIPVTQLGTCVVRELLESHGPGTAPLLEPVCQDTLRNALRLACAAAGVPRLKVHALRHVYASHAVQLGIPASTVARLLGYADGGALVARLYGRWMPHDAEARAVEGLTTWRAPSTPAAAAAN